MVLILFYELVHPTQTLDEGFSKDFFSEACDLLEAYIDEPLFWNATSTRWILQITFNPQPMKSQELVHLLVRFSAESYGIDACCWAAHFDPELQDEVILDVLAIGQLSPEEVA